MDICARATPPLLPVGSSGRQVACYLFGDNSGDEHPMSQTSYASS